MSWGSLQQNLPEVEDRVVQNVQKDRGHATSQRRKKHVHTGIPSDLSGWIDG